MGGWVIYNRSCSSSPVPVMILNDGEEYELGRDSASNPVKLLVTDMKVSRRHLKVVVSKREMLCTVLGNNALKKISASEPSSFTKYGKDSVFTWREGEILELYHKSPGEGTLQVKRVPSEKLKDITDEIAKRTTESPSNVVDIQTNDVVLLDSKMDDAEREILNVVPEPTLPEPIAALQIDLTQDTRHITDEEERDTLAYLVGEAKANDFPDVAEKNLGYDDNEYAYDEQHAEEEKSADKREIGDITVHNLPFLEDDIITKNDLKACYDQRPMEVPNSNDSYWSLVFQKILDKHSVKICDDVKRAAAVKCMRETCGCISLSDAVLARGETYTTHSLSNASLTRGASASWLMSGASPRNILISPRRDGAPLSPQRLWNKYRNSFTWISVEGTSPPSNEDAIGVDEIHCSKIRTADGCPFFKRHNSSSSIMASDKHTSPRALKRSGSSLDLPVDEKEESKSSESVTGSTDGSKKDPGPRVGSDYQVDVPGLLSQLRVSDDNLGAWSKMQIETPKPLAEEDDDIGDTTEDWSPEERYIFHKGMYQYLKDFASIYRRNETIFKKKSARDLILYYYRRFKDTDEYRKWKEFVATTGEETPLPVILMETNDGTIKAPTNAKDALAELMRLGILQHGPEKMIVKYHHEVYKGSLQPDGCIEYNGTTFDSPADFSAGVKQSQNSDLKDIDDGWDSVFYGEKSLLEIASACFSSHVMEQLYYKRGRKRTLSECSSYVPRNYEQPGNLKDLFLPALPPTKYPWLIAKAENSSINRGRTSRYPRSTQPLVRGKRFFHLQSIDNESESDMKKGAITLRQLIEANLIVCGDKALRVLYKGRVFSGNLQPNGDIIDGVSGITYTAPQTWTIKLKSSINPNVRTDSGWYSALYVPPAKRENPDEDLQSLHYYKKLFMSTDIGVKNKQQTTKPSRFCICQTDESSNGIESIFVQCSKATGICNGWVHLECFGFNAITMDQNDLKDFVCPLCSGDGIQLHLEERFVDDKPIIYGVGTIVMCRVDFPTQNPIGWFPAIIDEVDMYHHRSSPYRIRYAFDMETYEWIDLAPNDPTKVLANDWMRHPMYSEQDIEWRTAAKVNQ